MFRTLLSSAEKRQLELLEHLSDGYGCTMEELSSVLNYSIRTIRTDIDHFRKNFQDLFTIHLSKDNHWSIEGKYSLSVLHGINRIYKENINVQLLQLVMDYRNMSIEEYARRLHSSYSSLFRNIKTVNRLLKEYELTLTTKPLQIKGEIHQLRYFYSLLYWKVLHKLPDSFPYPYLDKVERFVEELKENPRFEFSMVEREKLVYYMAISLMSIERGEVETRFSCPMPVPVFLRKKLEALFEELQLPVSEHENELLAFYILQHYKDKQEILQETRSDVRALYQSFEKYVHNLSTETGIQLKNAEDFLSEITCRALHKQYYKGGSFLVGNVVRQDMVDSFGMQYTNFVETATNLLHHYPLIEESLPPVRHSFVYWMATHWEGFFDEISRLSQKVTVLVISELGFAQEKFIRAILEHEFPFNLLCYEKTTVDMNHAPPDVVLTDTYSMDILSMGMKARHVVVIDYAHMDRVFQEMGDIILHAREA